MTSRKALGRGLKALIPDVPPEAANQDNIRFIRIDKISPNPFQPREIFDEEKLAELARSIAEKGVIQPITVRPYDDGYQLIAGERRFRCVNELGIEKIPAFILDVQTDEDMLELSIIENIHREDLNPIDIANSYRRLIDECNLTQEEVANKVGKDRATVTNFLRLLKLPRRIQESAQNGEISMGHARALLSAKSSEDQVSIWQAIVKNDLPVRKVEKMVQQLGQKQEKKKTEPAKSPYIKDVENRLRTRLTTKVLVKERAKGGTIEIDYYSDDDLDRLLSMIIDEK